MPTPPRQPTFRPLLIPALAALTGLALLVSGCGTSKPDTARGRTLFVQKCGVCHALAQAGTTAQMGPNLDDAFAAARAAGEGGTTIEGVVAAQVEHPRPATSNPSVSMPPHVVSGQDLVDVAAYVGQYAGAAGAAAPKAAGGAGEQIFSSNGCGGCHTLAAAKAGGAAGPNLDKVLPGKSESEIEVEIVDPNKKITPGYTANLMPPNFGTLLSKAQLKELIKYLVESTSKGAKK